MTRAAATNEPRTLTFRVPVDDLAKYAGITALVTTILGVAGILATVAYLSAWNVPAPVVRLDPLTAALRSEVVVYQFALMGAVLFGLVAAHDRLGHRGRAGMAGMAGLLALVVAVVVMLAASRAVGPALAITGAVLLFVALRRERLGQRGIVVLFAVISLSAAFLTGTESGTLIRDEPAYQTPVSMTTRAPLAGLAGGIEESGAWRYDDLYLVFRDSESLYVSRPGAGAVVWIVPSGSLMGLGITSR